MVQLTVVVLILTLVQHSHFRAILIEEVAPHQVLDVCHSGSNTRDTCMS